MSRLLLPLTIVTTTLFVLACDKLPRDPKQTLKRVQGNRIVVGLIENPPWVIRTVDEPSGAEVKLIGQFAAGLGATPEWRWGSEDQLMEALEHYQLDVVIGGITSETPWTKRVGLTSSYFEEHINVGIPSSMSQPTTLKGMQIATEKTVPVASYLQREGAVPVPVDDVTNAMLPVAAPDWQIDRLGLSHTKFELRTNKHVMATPPGENGFIKRLDEFLDKRRGEMSGLLQQQVASR